VQWIPEDGVPADRVTEQVANPASYAAPFVDESAYGRPSGWMRQPFTEW
jgi:hypothetical protein